MGLLVGALAAIFSLEVVFLGSGLRLLPFAPFALALAVVDLTPGSVSSTLIDLLQYWAKHLLEAGVLLFTVGAGALAGAMAASGSLRWGALAVAALPWALDVVAALTLAGRQYDPVGTAVSGLVATGVYAGALRWMNAALRTPTPLGPTRRRALIGMGALALVLGSGGLLLAALGRRGVAVATALALPKPPAVTAPPFLPEDPAFDATPGLSPQLTKNADFYIVDTALFKPTIDPAEWRLTVDGLVDHPFELTYDELRGLDAVEQVQTLECISNPVGGELISTAKWTGIRVADLLKRAGVRSGAYDLVMTSWDGYTDSILMEKALEPTTLVAYGMNDEVLPVEHGFPARMLIPDIYGMKNVKWVAKLSVANFDYRGYWQERGWSDVAVVVTNARIDVPSQRTVRWSSGPVRIAGVAFAGARGIQSVEVSIDQGRTWRPATLGRVVNLFTWRRWYFDWTPDGPGEARLMVRATDGKGVAQPAIPREPFPNGSSGYHLVPVKIEKAT